MLRIKSAENKDIPALSVFCKNSVLGTKILCQISAYGLERDFLSVWHCTTEDGEIVAAISKFENSITLLCNEADFIDDIKVFVNMIGFDSLCTTNNIALKMSENELVTKKAYIYRESYNGEKIYDIDERYYRDCYNLISRNIPDSFSDTQEAYLFFLSDFTFRKRRDLARMKGFTDGGTVYSCALTSAETDTSAIISGVACDLSHRKSGLGKNTVLTLAQELKNEGKDVYVIALNESAEGFYEHIGFEFAEKISFIERK